MEQLSHADRSKKSPGVEKYSLFLRCKKGNEPRQALIHFSEIYCRGRYSLTELSTMLNLSLCGYSSCRRSTGVRLSRDKEFNVRLKELKIKLDNVKCQTWPRMYACSNYKRLLEKRSHWDTLPLCINYVKRRSL